MKVRILIGRSLVALAVLALSAGAVSAAILTVNFDDGNSPFTTVAGSPTVSTTYAHSDGRSLYIAPGDRASLSIPQAAEGGTVTLWIYDLGKWVDGSATGWRVGLTGAGNVGSAMVALHSRSYTPSHDGYQCGGVDPGVSCFGDWWSPQWASTDRQVVSLSPTQGDGSEGVGQWSEWSFTFATDGTVVMNLCDANGVPIPSNSAMTQTVSGGVSSLFLFGGGSALGGLYVDDIVINTIPEPMTMALLGAGALLAVVRRNRRK